MGWSEERTATKKVRQKLQLYVYAQNFHPDELTHFVGKIYKRQTDTDRKR